METNLNNLSTVDTADILQEAVQISLLDTVDNYPNDVVSTYERKPVLTRNDIKLVNSICQIFVTIPHTVCNFQNFYATQILRETNFEDSESTKSANL